VSLRPRTDRRQGILPFVFQLGEREDVTSRAGLPLVVETSRALRLDEAARTLFGPPRRQADFGAAEQLETLATLIAAGGDRAEDIRILGEDQGLVRLLGRPFASPDSLLDFLKSFHDEPGWRDRPPDKKAFVPPESTKLQALEQLNRTLVQRAADPTTTTATIDHDGTIIESHKRDALVAYEGTRGYQPLLATWAEEHLIVADEFRDGNVAGGEDPLRSVRRAFGTLPPTVITRYFRGDSADYYEPLLKYLVGEQIGFAISADMGKELRAVCAGQPEGAWQALEQRERERVDLAEVEFTPGAWPKAAEPLRYIALRCTPLQADLFAGVVVRYHAVVSNRRELTPAALITWHRGKAGTIEQVHRVLKDELGAGVMPCQLFGANAAWFRINVLTFNLLTALKRLALPERYRLARPKRLRFEVFTLPGKLAVHESQLSVQVSAADARLQELVAARQRLLQQLESTPA
jgi:Transposase DDE domain group 1